MSRKNKSYLVELKYQAVGDYLSGGGALREICRKYGIRSTRQLRNWIKLYNSHEDGTRKITSRRRKRNG